MGILRDEGNAGFWQATLVKSTFSDEGSFRGVLAVHLWLMWTRNPKSCDPRWVYQVDWLAKWRKKREICASGFNSVHGKHSESNQKQTLRVHTHTLNKQQKLGMFVCINFSALFKLCSSVTSPSLSRPKGTQTRLRWTPPPTHTHKQTHYIHQTNQAEVSVCVGVHIRGI